MAWYVSLNITIFNKKQTLQSANSPYEFHGVRRTDDNDNDDDGDDDDGDDNDEDDDDCL